MHTNFDTIKKIIQLSKLSVSDKKELVELFSKASDADLESALALFMEDAYWISVINENFKAKKTALKNKDANIWQEIMNGEESQLKTLGA